MYSGKETKGEMKKTGSEEANGSKENGTGIVRNVDRRERGNLGPVKANERNVVTK